MKTSEPPNIARRSIAGEELHNLHSSDHQGLVCGDRHRFIDLTAQFLIVCPARRRHQFLDPYWRKPSASGCGLQSSACFPGQIARDLAQCFRFALLADSRLQR
jgi:hypothetical protein